MGNLKKAASYETAKVLSDRSHDIPTRKEDYTMASPDMQLELMFILSENIDKIMLQGCTTILIGIMSTELTRLCAKSCRARFDYKRKDEDDMAKSTKTYEERIRALEKKEQESIEATKSSLHSERN